MAGEANAGMGVGVGAGVDVGVGVDMVGRAVGVWVATDGDPHAERTSSSAIAARARLMG